jgi:enamine deaminase RidA (YjgF/YER057c/UK114 family)
VCFLGPRGEGRELKLDRYDPFQGALPFSLAVKDGNAVHVSGMVGLDPAVSVLSVARPKSEAAAATCLETRAGSRVPRHDGRGNR